MNKKLLITAAILIVAVAAGAYAYNKQSETGRQLGDSSAQLQETNEPGGEAMKSDNFALQGQFINEGTAKPIAGTYQDYSADKIATEHKAGNKVVLFFHAPWCPFCKAANTAFLEKAGEIPSKVVVLKTDYDSNTELKKKYGVTYQHTFVQVDANGNMITKWNGGDIDMLKQNLK